MKLVQMMGNMAFNIFFTVKKAPSFAAYLIVFVAAFGALMWYEVPHPPAKKVAVEGAPAVARKPSLSERFTSHVLDVAAHYALIGDYNKMPVCLEEFQALVDENVASGTKGEVAHCGKTYLPIVLCNMLAAAYMCMGGTEVLNGSLQAGSFLVTLKVVQANGGLLEKFHNAVLQILGSASALKSVSNFLILEVDIKARKKALKYRKREHRTKREMTTTIRDRFPADSSMKSIPIRDMMTIDLSKLYIGYGDNKVITNLSATLKQQTITAIQGPHSSGKRTLIKMLARILLPHNGSIFVPEHLCSLHLDKSPDLLGSLSLFDNLSYGQIDEEDIPSWDRVTSILQDLVVNTSGVQETMLMDILRAERAGKPFKEWWRMLTQTDLYIVHIARGLIFNPELLVMDRVLGVFHEDKLKTILNVLRRHIEDRGLYVEGAVSTRRPRTIAFITLDATRFPCLSGDKVDPMSPFPYSDALDAVWTMDMDGQVTVNDRDPSMF